MLIRNRIGFVLFIIFEIFATLPTSAQPIGVNLNFGNVPIGQSKRLTMQPYFVSNTGITSYGCRHGMKMGTLQISGPDKNDFKIVEDGISNKICLPFSTLSATIEFTPSKEGRESVSISAEVEARDEGCKGVYIFPGCTAVGNGQHVSGAADKHPIGQEFFTHLHLIVTLNSKRIGIVTVQEETPNSPPKWLATFHIANRVAKPEGDPIKKNANGYFPPGTWPIYTDRPGWLMMPPLNPTSEGVAVIVVGSTDDADSVPVQRLTRIHGQHLGRGDYTYPTLGCLRMNNTDLLKLIKILKDYGSSRPTELTVP